MKTRVSLILIVTLAIAFLNSCEKEIDTDSYGTVGKNTKEVSVPLELEFESCLQVTPKVKSVDDPDEPQSTAIHNICVLQYDGTSDDAALVGEVHYLRDDVPDDDENHLDLRAVKLATSEGELHTLVILTNTYAQLPRVETLGEMLNLQRDISNQADLFGHYGSNAGFPENGEYSQQLNAIAVSVIDGRSVRAKLRRAFAKIEISIKNTGKDGMQIRQTRLCNVPKKVSYVSDYHYVRSNTTWDEDELREQYHDSYDPACPFRFNYQATEFEPEGGVQDLSMTYYMPCNMRGEIENDMPSEKNRKAETNGATYLEIVGGYGEGYEKPIVYSFFLGADLVKDFNVNPNSLYQYEFRFDGKGNVDTDSRIEDFGGIDFDLDANCYMLKPSPLGTVSYSFNVVHRPNIFWGDRYGFHSDSKYADNYIQDGEVWKARIIWSDFAMTREQAIALLPIRQGSNTGAYMDKEQRLIVNVPSDCPLGNVLVGIYKDDPEKLIWSWHLWITDYAPDDIGSFKHIDGTYVYKVPGGEVHRYIGDMWRKGGRYENAYIMDRSIGALDDKYHESTDLKSKFYQFGRKDPFNSDIYCWTYDAETLAPQKSTSQNGLIKKASYQSINGGNGHNVPYTVNNPTHFITGNIWLSANDTFAQAVTNDGTTQYWNDPCPEVRLENEEIARAYENKSFFDPCPPGWRVATKGSIDDFVSDTSGAATGNPAINFQWGIDDLFRGRGFGRTYVPLHYLSQKGNHNAQTAFAPANGFRNDNGDRCNQNNCGGWWFSSPAAATQGVHLTFQSSGYWQRYFVRNNAFAVNVRCVKE